MTSQQQFKKSSISMNSSSNAPINNSKNLHLHKCIQQCPKLPSNPKDIFPYPWKIMPKHPNKNFHTHQKLVYSTVSTHQIPIISYPLKKKIKIHLTFPKATYNAKLHKSSTLSKKKNKQKKNNLTKLKQTNNSKIPKKKTCLCTKFFISHIQHSRILTRVNSYKITMPTIYFSTM